MEKILGDLTAQHDELADLLSELDEAGWNQPSACAGWSIADVVLHLAQTDEMAIASVSGEFSAALARFTDGLSPASTVDDGAGQMVERERGEPFGLVHDRWRAAARGIERALKSRDPSTRVEWVAGRLSARTLATTRVTEAWIHTGDVAHGLGVTLAPTNRLLPIARLAWRTLPYAFMRAGRELAGPVAFELRGPHGDSWRLADQDADAATTVTGDALELCLVAARRLDPSTTGLRAEGPDGDAVLELVRTFA